MTTELSILGWTVVLALVQTFLHSGFRNRETGTAYNAGPRDEPGPPPGKVTGRLQRAQANLMDNLPLFAIGVLVAHVAGREGALTLWGAWLFLLGRLAHLPLYAFGVSWARTGAFLVSLLGLVLILVAILRP